MQLDVANLRSRVAELEKRLREILQARDEAEQDVFTRTRQEEFALEETGDRRTKDLKGRRLQLQAQREQDREGIEAAHARRLARIEAACLNACSRIQEGMFVRIGQIREGQRKAKSDAFNNLQKANGARVNRLARARDETSTQREEAEKLRKRIAQLASALGAALSDRPADSDDTEPLVLEQYAQALNRGLAECQELLQAHRRELKSRLSRPFTFPLVCFFVLLALVAGVAAVWELAPEWIIHASAAAAGVLVISLSTAYFCGRALRKKALVAVHRAQAGAMRILQLLQRQEALLARSVRENDDKYLEEKIGIGGEFEESFRASDEGERKSAEWELADRKQRRADLVERALRKRDRELEKAEARIEAEARALDERHREERERERSGQAARLETITAKRRQEVGRLAADWNRVTAEFGAAGAEALRHCLARFPAWSDRNESLGREFPDFVHVGNARLSLEALGIDRPNDAAFSFPEVTMPLALSFPQEGSLFLSADPGLRDKALQTLFNTSLRILTAFPPGKAKFLIFDPVGLGQSFSALMHLADYDESLVGGRIWTEPVHLEAKLAELTEHIEKVIQKYLRNRYASIDLYNREVGVMAEAYRFLVIADFPSGFSELALDRLASVLTSGARCGVYALILSDGRKKLPVAIEKARLERKGLALQWTGETPRLEDESLKRAIVTVEPPPTGEALTALLHAIGRQCVDAERVEVPFEIAAPKDEQRWSLSAEKGIRVPLGRAGADRLQYLDLGRGTAQHALIAGKTGSGKSTLFHTIITNLALWFSPKEVEFYLIDYKKGVEFKTFATHRLPHGRVVAIESDREFGLSVLNRLDKEFTFRAELFRKNGVQDFASYRGSGGEYLPRTLLIIDEFQEFFVEEDAIAQEAALLLDRIVRQGRAFGVHVILGSQTLGGSYTLAKSTLGQMAVRIALQCNEADSYLILSDDNAAARLLSRPGEAIYNDMAGRIEGNNPFQGVWLSDEVEDRHLREVRRKADHEGWQPREPMTVFEGNVPADLRSNELLKKRLAQPVAPEGDMDGRAWIGEANAIKGPTEVRFKNQGGSNLLIVGQQREASLGIVFSSVVSLAAAYPPGSLRFVILDGSPPDAGHGARLTEAMKSIPHGVDLPDYAGVTPAMEELDGEVKARMEGTRKADTPIFLVVYDLQRYRKLRQGDEFSLSGGEEEKPTPDKCFANILSEGPAQRVHTIIWCDSLNNLNRALNRKLLREFEMRVLFQMSASDSSEIIDTPLANKLGLHRSLLFLEDEATLEKFRPYAMPDAELLEEIRRSLHALAGRSPG